MDTLCHLEMMPLYIPSQTRLQRGFFFVNDRDAVAFVAALH